jgi:hypothetical protein
MNSTAPLSITVQTSSEAVPAVPAWFGEVAVTAHALRRLGVLATIEERVRFARRRFGHYDLIDLVVVLLGYAISGARTLETFYESLRPFAAAFMALVAHRAGLVWLRVRAAPQPDCSTEAGGLLGTSFYSRCSSLARASAWVRLCTSSLP